MDFNDYLETIERRLERSFDVVRNYIIDNYDYDFFAKYNSRTERYILTEKDSNRCYGE